MKKVVLVTGRDGSAIIGDPQYKDLVTAVRGGSRNLTNYLGNMKKEDITAISAGMNTSLVATEDFEKESRMLEQYPITPSEAFKSRAQEKVSKFPERYGRTGSLAETITDGGHPYAEFRTEDWEYAAKSQKTAPINRDSKKIHRNDPCTCGSGKKYKKCCLITPQPPAFKHEFQKHFGPDFWFVKGYPNQVFDIKNRFCFQFEGCQDEEYANTVLSILNGEMEVPESDMFSRENENIFFDGGHIITIRGWGRLTGGKDGLSNEDACDVQDAFGDWIVSVLNGKEYEAKK